MKWNWEYRPGGGGGYAVSVDEKICEKWREMWRSCGNHDFVFEKKINKNTDQRAKKFETHIIRSEETHSFLKSPN